MILFLIGLSLMLGIMTALYIGMKNNYSAIEGLAALILFQTFYMSISFLVYGLALIF